MRRRSAVILALAVGLASAGCIMGELERPVQPLVPRLPVTVGGQTVTYTIHAGSDMGDQHVFFDSPIAAASGQPTDSRIAIGMGPGGFTITALQVPDADARVMIDPTIVAGDFKATSRDYIKVGGKFVTVLTLPPTTHDKAYIYAFDDVLVVITTSTPAFADEALGALP
jgi:hypothetical protein